MDGTPRPGFDDQHHQLGGAQLVDDAPIADTKPKAGAADELLDVVVASVRIGGQFPQLAVL
jgi:hypothetical protein